MTDYNAYFDTLKAQGIKLTEGQKRWYIKKAEVLQESMKKEYPSTAAEAFEVNTVGLYYAAHVSAMRAQKRIINIPYDPTLKVHTAWDIGFTDFTSIIFFCVSGKEIHIVDFIELTGCSLVECIKALKSKDYIYGTHLAPHDIRNHEYSTGVTRYETASKLGINFVIVPDVSIADGIDTVRNMFPRLWVNNSDSCLSLVHHIENYSQVWDTRLGCWSGRPNHDPHSHAADSLRYLCVGLDLALSDAQGVTQDQADAMWRQHGRRI